MAQVDYYIRLDLKKEHEQGVQHIKYGDANTRVLRFFVHGGGKTYDISDKHVVLHFLKSDGTSGSVRCFHAAEKGTCYCIVSSQMSAVAGEVKCDLKIYSGDTLLHSPKFYLLVGTDALSGDTSADVFGDEKADKVEDAAAGNFAGLDVEGNLTDSGYNADDFNGKVIWPIVYTAREPDNPPAPFDVGEYWYAPTAKKLFITVEGEGGTLAWEDVTEKELVCTNLFLKHDDTAWYCKGDGVLYQVKAKPTSHTHSGYAEKVSGAVNGDFAGLDLSGNLIDSGKKAADFAAASHTHALSQVTGLPVPTLADYGKYLAVNAAGEYVLVSGPEPAPTPTYNITMNGYGADPFCCFWLKSDPSTVYYNEDQGYMGSVEIASDDVLVCKAGNRNCAVVVDGNPQTLDSNYECEISPNGDIVLNFTYTGPGGTSEIVILH